MASLDALRTTLHRALVTTRGDQLGVLRVSKDLLRRANVTLGRPLASSEEIEGRRAAKAKLANLRSENARPAPVRTVSELFVYFEKDRNVRELVRVEEFLTSKGLPFRKLDVAGDEATKAFVMREARCKEDELPVVFVEGKPVGGYNAIVELDLAGKLSPQA